MFGAEMYIPGATSAQADAAARNEPTDSTPTAARAGLTGAASNPTIWLLVILLVWAGIVHFGLEVSLGGQ